MFFATQEINTLITFKLTFKQFVTPAQTFFLILTQHKDHKW